MDLSKKLFNLKFYGGGVVGGFAGATLTYIALDKGEDEKRELELQLLKESEEALIEIADERQEEIQEQYLKLLALDREIKGLQETIQAKDGWLDIYKGLIKQKNEKQAVLESELLNKATYIEELKQRVKDQEDLLEALKRNYKEMEAKYKAAWNNFVSAFEMNIKLSQHVKEKHRIDLPKEVSFLVPTRK